MNKEFLRFDMHTHSESSHDSVCPVSEMAKSAEEKGLSGFAVTDHCDIEFCETQDLEQIIKQSISDAKKVNKRGGIRVFHGIEIGELMWHKNVTDEILGKFNFDVVIGSVHAVKLDGYEMPYSQIDFSEIDKKTLNAYMEKYFDDMLEMLENSDIDILAHMTCPLRYINGKYQMEIESQKYKDKIKAILKYIIKNNIALEINTSCVYEGSGYCEFLPEEWIIIMYKNMGGYLITTGSDAHIAENSANSFDKLYAFLTDMGFEKAYYFENRRPVGYNIK